MKFGHDMHRVVRVSDAEWAPYFMQYKLLKKCIKQIRAEPSSPPVPPRAADEEAGEKATMAKSAPEVPSALDELRRARSSSAAELVLEGASASGAGSCRTRTGWGCSRTRRIGPEGVRDVLPRLLLENCVELLRL